MNIKETDIVFIVIGLIFGVGAMISVIQYIIRIYSLGGVISGNFDKMQFTTLLTPDEVVIRFRHYNINDIFEYKFYESETLQEYIFIVNRISKFFYGDSDYVKYKITINHKENRTVIWFVLLESKYFFSDRRCGLEMKDFMKKKVEAIRTM